jgi:hypothetical protein
MPLASPLRLAIAVLTTLVFANAGVEEDAIIDPSGASRDFLRTYDRRRKKKCDNLMQW